MQKFAVIGLGRYGKRLAINLANAGQEVIAVDKDLQLIEEIRDQVTLAVSLDCTDEQALQSQSIHKVDAAIVCIGDDFESNLLCTRILKDLGVKRVISRAVRPISARVLARCGADDVVNPEDEAADRWATRLVTPKLINQLELAGGHSLIEIKTPAEWVGKTLRDINPRQNLGIHIVAIKHIAHDTDNAITNIATPEATQPQAFHAGSSEPILMIPSPTQSLEAQDILILLGQDENLSNLPTETDA